MTKLDWPPRWLGRAYSKLYNSYASKEFDLDQARQILESTVNTRMVLSNLTRIGWAIRIARGSYMLVDPELVVATLDGSDWQNKVPQKVYLPLIARFASCALRAMNGNLVSLVVYGSVGMGKAGPNSDIDMLLVSHNLPRSYSQRASLLADLIQRISPIRNRLWQEKGIFPDLDITGLTPADASINQPIYLDMIDQSIIILDRNDFLSQKLEKLREELERIGSKKICSPKGTWFWSLKPSLKPGEVLEI